MHSNSEKPSKKPLVTMIIVAVIVVFVVVIISAAGGAYAGQQERDIRATETTDGSISVQFDLGMQNLTEGQYDLALQRFRWVEERAPGYPGLLEAITQTISLRSETENLIASPDENNLASKEELFTEAINQYENENWAAVITFLDELIGTDPTFKQVEVQNMLYDSLKTLGLIYIRGDRLEEGIFLLERSEEIKALDDISKGEIYLANLYLTAKSYWNINWQMTIANLSAIREVAPNYRDSKDLLIEAYTSFGDQLMALLAYCDAEMQYAEALAIEGNADTIEKLNTASEYCLNPPQTTPAATGDATILPAGTLEETLVTTTAEGTNEYTGIPTQVPTPTLAPTEETP